MDALISAASGTARSANFVLTISFNTVPAPSIAFAMSGAPIAGLRSAPRNTLRVITVTVCASAVAGSANKAAASGRTILLMQPIMGVGAIESHVRSGSVRAMGFDQYHEPPDELPARTRTFARLCASLTEEAEAIGWYEQRLAVEQDAEALAVMRNAQTEEFKHFAMDLEFLLRRTPVWRDIARGILFVGGRHRRSG